METITSTLVDIVLDLEFPPCGGIPSGSQTPSHVKFQLKDLLRISKIIPKCNKIYGSFVLKRWAVGAYLTNATVRF